MASPGPAGAGTPAAGSGAPSPALARSPGEQLSILNRPSRSISPVPSRMATAPMSPGQPASSPRSGARSCTPRRSMKPPPLVSLPMPGDGRDQSHKSLHDGTVITDPQGRHRQVADAHMGAADGAPGTGELCGALVPGPTLGPGPPVRSLVAARSRCGCAGWPGRVVAGAGGHKGRPGSSLLPAWCRAERVTPAWPSGSSELAAGDAVADIGCGPGTPPAAQAGSPLRWSGSTPRR